MSLASFEAAPVETAGSGFRRTLNVEALGGPAKGSRPVSEEAEETWLASLGVELWYIERRGALKEAEWP